MNKLTTTRTLPSSNPRATLLVKILEKIEKGRLTIESPSGETICISGNQNFNEASLSIKDWKVADLVLSKGDIGAAEGYILGFWDSDDPAELLALIAKNRLQLREAIYGSWLSLLKYRLRDLISFNSRQGAKKNIQHHYDIGNEFYSIWLDDTMTYSCALFGQTKSSKPDLFKAQIAKYDRIINELRIQKNDNVLEIGSGWGGFFRRCAAKTEAKMDTITISKKQFNHAYKLIQEQNLSDMVSLKLCDYRDIRGQYDYIVSIEMFEAVGERFWGTYFRSVARNLKTHGEAIIQTIVIKEDLYHNYKNSTDFIRQFIFPGGTLPSRKRFKDGARKAGLEVVEQFEFGQDYAETLRLWLARYQKNIKKIESLGFDQSFHRMWTLYLNYCRAGFLVGDVGVVQFRLKKLENKTKDQM